MSAATGGVARARRRLRGSSALLTGLLALLTAVGPISTDMYLPAFPFMRVELNAAAGETQMTLAAWFLGLSVGQLTHGHLADQFGRRLPLLLGTALYTVASVGCAMADTMSHLSWWRLWAAFGGAASLVIPRAIIADVARTGADAARMVSRMVLVMGVVPALAPVAGGLIAVHWNWRAIFWLAAVYGGLCSVLIALLLPDTRRHRGRRLRVSETAMRYVRVWGDKPFRTYVLQGAFATFSLFSFLGGAPAVFQMRDGLSPTAFGSIFVLNTVGYVAGTQLNARLLARLPAERVLSRATVALLATTIGMFAAAATGLGGVAALAIGMMLCMGCLGFVLPGAALGSVLRQGRVAGAASALYGTVVFFLGSIGSWAVGGIGEPGAVLMTGLMVAGAVAALLCDRSRRRGGRRARAGERRRELRRRLWALRRDRMR